MSNEKIRREDLCKCGHPRRMREDHKGCTQVITKIELEIQELGLCKCKGFVKMDMTQRRINAFQRN